MKLKYGMNPYQKYAEIINNSPLKLHNGNPSLINILDALNSWQLVREIYSFSESVAASSFKHVTPSGVAIAKKLTKNEKISYFLDPEKEISPLASAYTLARGSDRLASFGDFIAVNDAVDLSAAMVIKNEVSDGIIAPVYNTDALEKLKKKKNGNYVIIEIDKEYNPPKQESRDVFGIKIVQDRNDIKITKDMIKYSIVTENKTISENIFKDICLGLITLKYTQSNSICVIRDGHVIGIGSGQQSRVLCANLAISKAVKWKQKRDIDYDSIVFQKGATRTEKDQIVEDKRAEIYNSKKVGIFLNEAALCSDGFFPQIDSIQLAAKNGVKYIAAPMGSIRDKDIINYCNDQGIIFCDTGIRLFHH